MKRAAKPALSAEGLQTLEAYATALREETAASTATVRNYLSDLRQFMAWCETMWAAGQEHTPAFTPRALTTPVISRYRAYLQHSQHVKPASVNRALVSIKRYVTWALETGQIGRNVAAAVKLIPTEQSAPHQLSDTEEEALVAAVTATGNLRDQTIVIVLLHTGLRARELCTLRRERVTLGKRSGVLRVYDKRHKYREVPLNATARAALTAYLGEASDTAQYVFPSAKTVQALTERALGHLIKKYAIQARLSDVSPHDLRHQFGYRNGGNGSASPAGADRGPRLTGYDPALYPGDSVRSPAGG